MKSVQIWAEKQFNEISKNLKLHFIHFQLALLYLLLYLTPIILIAWSLTAAASVPSSLRTVSII